MPTVLAHAVETCLGSPIVDFRDVHGGMTPGPAATLSLDNGASAFVKAMSKGINARSYELYQQEAAVLAVMRTGVPAARLWGIVEVDDWVALVMDRVPGTAAGPPWTNGAVAAVASACAATAEVIAPAGVPPVLGRLPDLDGWTKLAAEPDDLTGWEIRHVDRLAAATSGWRTWTAGRLLTHQDIRADNAIIDPASGTAVLVDWGCAAAGAPWLDRALLAADVVAAGHAEGPEVARRQALELLLGEPSEASRFVIAQAGMWRRNSTLPAHPGMPTHRAWQRARADVLQPLIEDLLAVIGS
ncbi:phosphotransferase family protein [Actinoplanes philippinensis]|uniref:phosphotransferase family protein n=1 Tax=Actinoplanes philippinensis TaxID=35752 RepID=UPI0034101716